MLELSCRITDSSIEHIASLLPQNALSFPSAPIYYLEQRLLQVYVTNNLGIRSHNTLHHALARLLA